MHPRRAAVLAGELAWRPVPERCVRTTPIIFLPTCFDHGTLLLHIPQGPRPYTALVTLQRVHDKEEPTIVDSSFALLSRKAVRCKCIYSGWNEFLSLQEDYLLQGSFRGLFALFHPLSSGNQGIRIHSLRNRKTSSGQRRIRWRIQESPELFPRSLSSGRWKMENL